MSSSNHSPEDFCSLRKLLALKRYEVPPPGYFEGFSERVMLRIQTVGLRNRMTWWDQLIEGLAARPLLAGAYALCAISLAFMGFRVSESLQPAPIGIVASEFSTWSPVIPTALTAHQTTPPIAVPAEFGGGEDRASSVSPLVHQTSSSSMFRPTFTAEEVRRVGYPVR